MKVDSSPTVVSLGQAELEASTKKAAAQPKAAPDIAPSGHATLAHLNQAFGSSGQDIDQTRVNELRQAILEGRLVMNTDKIADGLIASVRDILGKNEL